MRPVCYDGICVSLVSFVQSTKCRVVDGWSGTLGIKETETGGSLNEYGEQEGGGCLVLRAVILLALSSVHTVLDLLHLAALSQKDWENWAGVIIMQWPVIPDNNNQKNILALITGALLTANSIFLALNFFRGPHYL